MKINYSVKGEGPTLILLHGWGGSIDSLTPLQEQLAAKGFQVFNLDLPGFGKSEMLKEVMDLDDYVKFLMDLIERLNIFKPVLIGHSFGGRIAVAFAAKYPGKVSKMVLIDISGINPQNQTKKKKLEKQSKVFGKFFNLPLVRLVKPLVRKVYYKTVVGENDYLTAGKLKETFKKVVGQYIDHKLKEVKTDTLIIWGEHDNITPLWMGEKLAMGIKNSRLEVIEGAKHGLPLVQPELIARIIYLYLSK